MATKFLVKNVTARDGMYRYKGVDHMMKPGEQTYLEFPPEFYSVEIRVVEIKQ